MLPAQKIAEQEKRGLNMEKMKKSNQHWSCVQNFNQICPCIQNYIIYHNIYCIYHLWFVIPTTLMCLGAALRWLGTLHSMAGNWMGVFQCGRIELKTHPCSDSFFILISVGIHEIPWCKTRLGPTGFKFRLASICRGCIGIDMAEPGQMAGLIGLAERWESISLIRQRARRNGSLLEWDSAETTGVPSMILPSNMS